MWIYIVRHAETDGNRQRIVQTPDTPLSVRGLQQAQQFAKAYSQIPASHILCSDYARTHATASELHKKLKCSLTFSELLRERNFGELRGRSYDDIEDDFFAKDYHPLGGESYAQFVIRVRHAWHQIAALADAQDGDLVVVTHGLVVRCLLTDILMLSPKLLVQTDIKNTCVTKVSQHDHGHIPLLCDAAHLDEKVMGTGKQGAV